MPLRLSRRLFLIESILLAANACKSAQKTSAPLLIGVINYDQDEQITNRYTSFNRYLSSVLKAHVEIEPTFNERKALERIQSQAWSLVFAPPGVAANFHLHRGEAICLHNVRIHKGEFYGKVHTIIGRNNVNGELWAIVSNERRW